MSYGVGHRRGSDPKLLWLWRRSAATAPIQHLAWELSCATGAALKNKKCVLGQIFFHLSLHFKNLRLTLIFSKLNLGILI